MENVVNIINTRTNPLEFDITIQGVDEKETDVRFVIETGEVQFGFICHSHEDDDKWTVDIPPLPQLPKTSYNFHIEVVVDGYYFEPYRGTLNVTLEPEVKASDVNKTRPTVTVEPAGEISVREEQATRQLVAKRLDEKKPIRKKTVKKTEKPVPVVETEKDRIVMAALAEVKSTPKKVVKEGAGQKEFEIGMDDGKKGRPRKDGGELRYQKEYNKGYDEGRAVLDHEEWQEKTASKRQGVHYHESEDKTPRKSNLAGALEKLDEEPKLSPQAQKVRNILNKGKKK